MNYQKALENAIIYIEDRLEDDIKVEEVAHFVGYSYFHFNRQFQALIGESVGNYIKKRRLANAAHQLLYTHQKIIDIAIDNNFESAEAFSRAFKSVYKISPQKYRDNRIQTLTANKEKLNPQLLEHLVNHVTVHPQIVQVPEIKVVGIRKQTEIKSKEIKKLWEEFYNYEHEVHYSYNQHRKFGIYESSLDETHFIISEESMFSEVVGLEVESFENVPSCFVKKVIPGGRYAVFTHHGSLESFQQTINYIWGTWLLSTKEEVDSRETFEVMDERFQGYNHPDSVLDLYISVK